MNLFTKVGSVASAIGIVGGGVALTSYLYKGHKNIGDRLTGFGYQVLKFDNDTSDWATLENAYKLENNKGKKFSELKAKLQEHCKDALTKNPTDEDIYKLAKRWCVKEETVEAMLTRNKYTKLKSTSEEKAKWSKKVEELRNAPQGMIKIELDFTTGTEDNWISSLETSCNEILKNTIKTHNDDDFEKKFIQAKYWCFVKNTDINT